MQKVEMQTVKMQKVEMQQVEMQKVKMQKIENATDVVVVHLWQAAPGCHCLALGSPQLPPPPAGTTVLWPIPHPAYHQQPTEGTDDALEASTLTHCGY